MAPETADSRPVVASDGLIMVRTATFLEAMQKAVEAGKIEGEVAKVANFGWDRICPWGPYESRFYELVYGKKPETPEDRQWMREVIPWLYDEGSWTVVLVAGNELTPIRVLRNQYDFRGDGDSPVCIARGDAGYRIDVGPRGKVMYIFDRGAAH